MRNYKDLNDYEIIYMVSENDEDATNLLIKKYRPIIVNIAKEYCKIGKKYGLELEDLIQEGYLGLLEASKKYLSNQSLFYTYAIICIESKIKNIILKHSSLKNKTLNESISLFTPINDGTILLDCISAGDVNTEITKDMFENFLKELLYKLNINKASILELRYNGFTNKEIAVLLDKSVSNISRTISRMRKKYKVDIEK